MKKLIDFIGILCAIAFVVWLSGCTMFVPETNQYDAVADQTVVVPPSYPPVPVP